MLRGGSLWCLLLGVFSLCAQAESLDVTHSQIQFYGTQMGAQVEGQFKQFSGNVHFDPNDLAHSSAHLVIDLGSIDLASEESEDEIKGTHWFNTAHFPQAVFDSSSITSQGGNRYLIKGSLKIKGSSQSVQIPMEWSRDPRQGVAQGRFQLQRSMFGVGDGTWAATDSVKNEVVVRYRLTLNP